MAHVLPDMPSGPLDKYRKKSSFDWKQMKVFLETEEIIKYQQAVYEEIQRHPILLAPYHETASLDEQRRLASLRMLTLNSISLLSTTGQLGDLRKSAAGSTVGFQLDPAVAIKRSIAFAMFPSVLQSMGTERHIDDMLDAFNGKIVGAYCLTEIGHGSNAKQMKTTATYDKNTREFLLNTPNFEAAKCWAGNLGQLATHAAVYAQLITPDGINHGLHSFVVPIRDPNTYQPYPGVTVGDMGEKIGLNGIDNGFIMFKNYRISRERLLNRTGDVSEDGVYITPYRDPNKRYGASLGALSIGRVFITLMCSTYMGHALTIALRYGAVRKQFGPEENEEVPVLEYQTHQYRLIPYLAVTYVLKMFSTYFIMVQYKFSIDMMGENKNNLADLGLELHALSSASKPVAGWTVRDGIQECREACAGHGYLKVAGLGDIKNAHDANCTYEGENYVLIQQTSNWLFKLLPAVARGEKIASPLKSIDFLSDYNSILNSTFQINDVESFASYDNVIKIYRWLVCYLLKSSSQKYENLKQSENMSSFWAKNENQIFYSQNLAVAYIQHFIIQSTHTVILKAPQGPIRSVLDKLLSLYSVFSLQRHLATLYQGGYVKTPEFVTLLQNSILTLCKSLKTDSVSLIDAIAPPDFLVKSALGQSDGQVYKHLEEAFMSNPATLQRPSWLKEFVNWGKKHSSKL